MPLFVRSRFGPSRRPKRQTSTPGLLRGSKTARCARSLARKCHSLKPRAHTRKFLNPEPRARSSSSANRYGRSRTRRAKTLTGASSDARRLGGRGNRPQGGPSNTKNTPPRPHLDGHQPLWPRIERHCTKLDTALIDQYGGALLRYLDELKLGADGPIRHHILAKHSRAPLMRGVDCARVAARRNHGPRHRFSICL